MGYQESLVYVQPQCYFKQLIRAYDRAKKAGYYQVADVEPMSVLVLKKPLGEIPAGSKLLWVCGQRQFHTEAGIFGDNLKKNLFTRPNIRVIPVENVFTGPEDERMEGIDLDSPAPSENEHMRRYSATNYAFRLQYNKER